MISRLSGTLVYKDGMCTVIDVGGVGYEVFVPLTVASQLPEAGLPVSLEIHTHLREDALSLYGFGSRREKDVFELLIGVSGIGPKAALQILSNVSVGELAAAVLGANTGRLRRIPGIGAKTAERLVLELKDKLLKKGITAGEKAAAAGEDLLSELSSALLNLGYKPSEVSRAIEEVKPAAKEGAGISELVRRALGVIRG